MFGHHSLRVTQSVVIVTTNTQLSSPQFFHDTRNHHSRIHSFMRIPQRQSLARQLDRLLRSHTPRIPTLDGSVAATLSEITNFCRFSRSFSRWRRRFSCDGRHVSSKRPLLASKKYLLNSHSPRVPRPVETPARFAEAIKPIFPLKPVSPTEFADPRGRAFREEASTVETARGDGGKKLEGKRTATAR